MVRVFRIDNGEPVVRIFPAYYRPAKPFKLMVTQLKLKEINWKASCSLEQLVAEMIKDMKIAKRDSIII